MKLTKQQVKKTLHHQTINGETISYSYAQKSQATISMLRNQRLLIFNSNTGMLYYINEPKSLPFKTQVPKPKNNIANLNVSIAKNPPGTNQLNIQFVMKNQNNQQVSVEWNFELENKALVKQWQQVILDYKNKKIQEMQTEEEKKKQAEGGKQPANNAFIHDTLGFGLMRSLNKQQSKLTQQQMGASIFRKSLQTSKPPLVKPTSQEQIRKSNITPIKGVQASNIKQSNVVSDNQNIANTQNSKMTESKFQKQPQKNPSQSNIRQSNINIRQSNLGYEDNKPADLRQSTSKKNLNNSNLGYKQQLNQSNISNNYNNNSPGSQMKRSRRDVEGSKLTLRDQLVTIMQNSQIRQSRLDNNVTIERSRISDANYSPETDWNLKFLKRQDEEVLLEFQNFAVKSFFSILAQDQRANQSIRAYIIKNEAIVVVADARTPQAKKIKSEFRNYHFIMQSCKGQLMVGVPLACLIQFQGLVAIVKSSLPEGAPRLQLTQQIMLDLKDLQRYTRIKNNILKKAQLFDLSQIYQIKGKKLIYINQLIQYLPVHIQQSFHGGSLRPEHILDNVNQFMQGGMAHQANRQDMRTLHQALDGVKANVKALAKQLSNQDIFFANGLQLKTIMHQKGINLKYLPLLYNQVTNKNVKKYINTFMVAKVAKDNILQNLASLRLQNNNISMSQTVQNSFRLLIQGNTNVSNEFWKQIAINFRKQYGIPMSNHDILGPYFLNCLMKIIPGSYDLSKLDDKKVFFKDDGIIGKGFLVELVPKVKSFYRYTTELTDKIEYTCREEKLRENFEAIVEELELTKKQIPTQFVLSKVDEHLKEYLSYYVCPPEFESQGEKSLSHLKLFDCVGMQPPTAVSLAVTKNYLDWCLDKQKFDVFKKVLQSTLATIVFWFDSNHPYLGDFYENLSAYYEITGAIQQSINYMKESLAICIKNGGVTSKKTGYKYFSLAQKQLRAGRKNDSMENFIKAKNNMENYNDQTIKYPITLMKLSSLYLNMSQFENCIIYSKNAVQKFQELEAKAKAQQRAIPKGYYDQYCIKAIEIMTRAYEIQNKKNEFYRVAQLASAKYNRTTNAIVFQQLVKICFTAVIFKSNIQKCQVFAGLVEKVKSSNQGQKVTPQRCLGQLINLSQQFNVMQRFMFKFQSLQRIAADVNSRRALSTDSKQFVNITRNIVGAIGQDYVYGLIQQKEFE